MTVIEHRREVPTLEEVILNGEEEGGEEEGHEEEGHQEEEVVPKYWTWHVRGDWSTSPVDQSPVLFRRRRKLRAAEAVAQAPGRASGTGGALGLAF